MTWEISIDSCNDNWQRKIFESAYKQGFDDSEAVLKSLYKIHHRINDEETTRCAEDHQLWPCPTVTLLGE